MPNVFWAGIVGVCSLGAMAVLAQNQNTDMHGPATQTVNTQIASKAAKDGVYTARQATRGKEQYTTACAVCHGASMSNGAAPALAGNAFKAKWNAKTVGDVYQYASTRMPPGRAGSLSPQIYADIVAYVLQVNGYPAGNSLLPPDVKAQQDIAFDKAAQEAAVKAAQAQPQPPAATTTATTNTGGVFTEAQVARGKQHYTNPNNACSGCHGVDLGGSPGGPSLARGSFKLNWGGKTVGDLFEYAKTRMPPGRANSLEDQAYLDIVAYILQVNGFKAGANELSKNLEDLKKIPIPK